ncbi:MAG: hypothetical protein WBZ24_08770 [Anaerolineales bacterium]
MEKLFDAVSAGQVEVPKRLQIGLVAAAGLGTAVLGYFLPGGSDWYNVVRPAALAVLSGHSPYSVPLWFSPVWGLIPFLPLALFPAKIGHAVLFAISLFAYTFAVGRMKARPLAIVVFLLSPPIITALWLDSTDWIPLLGFVLPPQIGLFFVALKPQLGLPIAIFWLVEAIRKGPKEVLKVFGPVAAAGALMLAVYGISPFLGGSKLIGIAHNSSLWPVSLPLGLGLAVAALRKRDRRYAIAAGPTLSPYVMITSWSAPLMAVADSTAEMTVAVIGLWILAYLQTGF